MKADIMFLVDSSGSIGPENFSKMKTVMKNLVRKSQFGADQSSHDECKWIEVLDVVFVIDSSGSIDHDEYNIMKDFMIGLVKKAGVGKNQVPFGALKYADDSEVLFYLGDFDTKLEALLDKGILVLAVGITGANPVELLAMAGSSDKYFSVETFGGLREYFQM
ncbi:Collagen alpha-6 chain [Plecturocebus cupreus]